MKIFLPKLIDQYSREFKVFDAKVNQYLVDALMNDNY